MKKEKSLELLRAELICQLRADRGLCDYYCEYCQVHYKKGNWIERIDALSTAIIALESYGGDV